MLPPELHRRLTRLSEVHEPAKQRFFADTEERRGILLAEVRRARDLLLDALAASAQRPWPDLEPLWRETREYARRCDWNLIDIAALATSLRVGPAELSRRMASPLLAYQALRMLDDVIDGHLDYKGGYQTSYGALLRTHGAEPARGLTICAAALLLIEGAHGLDETQVRQLHVTLAAALQELHGIAPGRHGDYLRMVEGKMVTYSSIIYDPVLTGLSEKQPVKAFLSTTFLVAQIVNDLHDIADDRARNQPNFWLLHPDPAEAATAFGAHLDDLEAAYAALPETARPYGDTRLADLSRYALEAPRFSTLQPTEPSTRKSTKPSAVGVAGRVADADAGCGEGEDDARTADRVPLD